MLAFCKIWKKFDEITGKKALFIYLKEVESSYFNTTDLVDKLMDEVEQLFTENFAENDQKKAMKYLRPNNYKDSHFTSFFIGLFAGCLAALLSAYSVIAHISRFYSVRSSIVYIETAYPILSIFGLLVLHLFLYGCNILTWRRIHVNYSFIFEFNPTKHLKYRDVFLICTTSMSVVMGVMLVHSYLIINGFHSTLVQAIPILLFLFFLALLLCPFKVVYHSSRYTFLNVIRKIVMAPFCKVMMVDFFVADQLCSQVVMLRDLAYVSCYYMTGSYKTQDYGYCRREERYSHLPSIISLLPYYWRTMQCARRWFDEGQTCHLINMGKYISTMLAVSAKVAYDNEKDMKMLIILVAVSSITTVYQLYWDFVEDWGLLRFNSRNPWLRNDLMIHWKPIYFFSMGLNVILRLSWLHILLRFSFGGVDYRVTTFFLAALEVIRRAQGNFYRLENEHLNNAGKFRAVKAVPLPFQEVY